MRELYKESRRQKGEGVDCTLPREWPLRSVSRSLFAYQHVKMLFRDHVAFGKIEK